MEVKIDKYVGYTRLYLEINEKLIGEIYVFLIDHPKKNRPYYLLDEFYGDKDYIVIHSQTVSGFKGKRVGNLLLNSLIELAKEEKISSIELSRELQVTTNYIHWGQQPHQDKFFLVE